MSPPTIAEARRLAPGVNHAVRVLARRQQQAHRFSVAFHADWQAARDRGDRDEARLLNALLAPINDRALMAHGGMTLLYEEQDLLEAVAVDG